MLKGEKWFATKALVLAAMLAYPLSSPALAESKDTIRFGTQSISPGFGRPESGTASPSVYTLWPIYDTLTRVSTKGDVSGLLAESWKNIDKLTWHVKLKKGIKFHNGKAFTASAVAGQFDYLLNNKEAAGTVAFSTNKKQAFVASVKRIDDHTVEIKTTQGNPELPRQLAGFWIPDSASRDDVGLDKFAKAPIGTGPYTLVEFKGGVDGRVILKRKDGGVRQAKVGNLQVIAVPGAAGRVQGILSDQLDIAQGVPFDSKGQLESGGHTMDVATRPSVMGLRFMSVRKSSPFHKKKVRQAANYALDRESMAKNLLGGITVPGSQCATRFTFGYNPNVKPYPYDPAKAKKLLAEAGYPNGFETEAMVLPGAFPADNEIYQFAAQQLTAVGIKVKLTNIQFAQWLDFWFGKKKGPEETMGFSDIFQNSCHNYNSIPFDAYPNLSCMKGALPSHCDEEETALLKRAMGEFDVEKRRKLIQELMVLNHENAPNLFFVELTDLTGLNKRVKNFRNTIQRFNFHEITLSN